MRRVTCVLCAVVALMVSCGDSSEGDSSACVGPNCAGMGNNNLNGMAGQAGSGSSPTAGTAGSGASSGMVGTAGQGGVPGTSGTAGSGAPGTAGTGITPGMSGTAGTGMAMAGTTGAAAGTGAAGTDAAGTGAAGTGAAGTGAAGTGGEAGSGAAGTAVAGTGAAGDAGTGASGTDAAGTGVVSGNGCTPAPAASVSDYGARGPFEVEIVRSTGPSNSYTMFKPTPLGDGGFLHPPTSWGNGVTTTPDLYVELLSTVASHGFVVIASDSPTMTAQLVRQGLEWLIDQNGSGEFQGKLAVDCASTIGYSMGGGSAVGAGSHPNVKAVVSMHGLQAAAGEVSGPLLLMTSDNDGFVTKAGYVQPTYAASSVQPTIMATEQTGLPPDFTGHLLPLGDAGNERAPLVAWLRYWIYDDQGAASWFFGSDCKLCQDPWTDIQKKNYDWD